MSKEDTLKPLKRLGKDRLVFLEEYLELQKEAARKQLENELDPIRLRHLQGQIQNIKKTLTDVDYLKKL